MASNESAASLARSDDRKGFSLKSPTVRYNRCLHCSQLDRASCAKQSSSRGTQSRQLPLCSWKGFGTLHQFVRPESQAEGRDRGVRTERKHPPVQNGTTGLDIRERIYLVQRAARSPRCTPPTVRKSFRSRCCKDYASPAVRPWIASFVLSGTNNLTLTFPGPLTFMNKVNDWRHCVSWRKSACRNSAF